MALTKCTECGQEVSTEARACPHCGNPNTQIAIEQKQNRNKIWRKIIDLIMLGAVGFILFKMYPSLGIFVDILNPFASQDVVQQVQSHSGQAIPLQEVKNLGYDFYVGQIDHADVTDITDDLKNQITKIAYNAHFPPGMLKNIPIIVLNNLALTGNQYIPAPTGDVRVPDLKADFLSEGGIYDGFGRGMTAVIYINKPIIAQGQLTEVLTHELGHAVSEKITGDDWNKFYKLRNIPIDTPRRGTSWNLSPEEDFAEAYKYTFTSKDVMTFYGLLIPTMFMDDFDTPCSKLYDSLRSSYTPKIDMNDPNYFKTYLSSRSSTNMKAIEDKVTADPKMQNCRRDVMSNPDKYTSAWRIGAPYKSIVSQETKDFINSIVNRL